MKKILETMLSTTNVDPRQTKLFLNITYNTDNQIKNGVISAKDLDTDVLSKTFKENKKILDSNLFGWRGPFALQISDSLERGKVYYNNYNEDGLLQRSVEEIDLLHHTDHNLGKVLLNTLYSLEHHTIPETIKIHDPYNLDPLKSTVQREAFEISDKCGMGTHSHIIMSRPVYDFFYKITKNANFLGSDYHVLVDNDNTNHELYIINGLEEFDKPIILSLYGVQMNNKCSKREPGDLESVYSVFVNKDYKNYISKISLNFDDSVVSLEDAGLVDYGYSERNHHGFSDYTAFVSNGSDCENDLPSLREYSSSIDMELERILKSFDDYFESK